MSIPRTRFDADSSNPKPVVLIKSPEAGCPGQAKLAVKAIGDQGLSETFANDP
jgi:hypothetical protein